MSITLIVGLGNPGRKYARTRHNAGFDVVDILSERWGIRLSKSRHKAVVGEGHFEGRRVALSQPQTYMNESGQSVSALRGFYKPDTMVIIYDDIDLPPGKLRIRQSGSAGSHNGMKSIIYHLATDQFPRVRVGIGPPPPGWELSDYVLSGYRTAEERKIAFETYVKAAEAVEKIITDGILAAMQTFN